MALRATLRRESADTHGQSADTHHFQTFEKGEDIHASKSKKGEEKSEQKARTSMPLKKSEDIHASKS
jgi:hypothetical protein